MEVCTLELEAGPDSQHAGPRQPHAPSCPTSCDPVTSGLCSATVAETDRPLHARARLLIWLAEFDESWRDEPSAGAAPERVFFDGRLSRRVIHPSIWTPRCQSDAQPTPQPRQNHVGSSLSCSSSAGSRARRGAAEKRHASRRTSRSYSHTDTVSRVRLRARRQSLHAPPARAARCRPRPGSLGSAVAARTRRRSAVHPASPRHRPPDLRRLRRDSAW